MMWAKRTTTKKNKKTQTELVDSEDLQVIASGSEVVGRTLEETMCRWKTRVPKDFTNKVVWSTWFWSTHFSDVDLHGGWQYLDIMWYDIVLVFLPRKHLWTNRNVVPNHASKDPVFYPILPFWFFYVCGPFHVFLVLHHMKTHDLQILQELLGFPQAEGESDEVAFDTLVSWQQFSGSWVASQIQWQWQAFLVGLFVEMASNGRFFWFSGFLKTLVSCFGAIGKNESRSIMINHDIIES